MKDLFPSYYYSLSDKEFVELWQKCTFIVDTNVLLDFYEHHKETREDFFKILESIKDRLWIPHQVALEYQENRINRIIQAESKFDRAKKSLDIITQETEEKLSQAFNFKCFPPEAIKEIIDNMKKVFDIFENKLIFSKEELIKINGPDSIRDKISNLFQGKIGESFINQDELDKIYKEGNQRYNICQPPGFLDKDKDKDKNNNSYINEGLVYRRAYGDLILWKQILKQVKSKPLTHIIFITGDNKDDWWEREHGKNIGPRRELTEEIVEAGASMFHMYKPELFLEWAGKSLQLDVKEESIQQVEEVSLSNSLSESEIQGGSSQQVPLLKALMSSKSKFSNEEIANTLESPFVKGFMGMLETILEES